MYRRPIWRRRPLRWRGPQGNGAVLSVLLALLLLVMLIGWVNRRLRPVLSAMAVSRVSNAVTAVVHNAISAGIEREQVSYDDMVSIETDENGRVTVLKSNMARANLLRTGLLAAALEEVSALSEVDFSIPLGNLTGLDFLSGKGPGVKVRVLSVGAASAAFENAFLDAGVNQTLHQIMLNITVTVEVLLPGETLETVVSTPVCVAETVIVGQVPETYLHIGEGSLNGLQG